MPTSGRLKKVERAVRKLRAQFLPRKFSATGAYEHPERVQSHTRAFLVLTHAELEEYFERWSRDIAQKAEKLWNRPRRTMTEPLAYLIATMGKDLPVPEDIDPPGNVSAKFHQIAMTCFTEYRHKIDGNHGIKAKKVVRLLGHVGVCGPFTVDIVTKLQTIAVKRGAHAHQSAKTVSVVHALDPQTEYDHVTALLGDLVAFDDWLVKYLKNIG